MARPRSTLIPRPLPDLLAGEGAKVGLGGDENTPHVVIPNPLSWMEGAFPF